ncbi:hypothetical protein HTVC131P_gp44 [Pelagibacter phage HTVC131P]|nr:hypothetical protein HTVC131P_gp44 [Pelagibacter phage HTVC131P]
MYEHYENQMTFWTNNTETMRIDSSGRVIIGGTTPDTSAKLTLEGGDLRFNTDDKGILWGNNEINGNNASDFINIVTAGSERMRIDSSGNVLINTTDASTTTAGIKVRGDIDAIASVRDSNPSVYFGRLNSDGDILNFRKDSTTVGRIGVTSTDNVFLSGNSTHAGIMVGTSTISPFKNGGLVDNEIDFGSSNFRWNDIYLGGGLYVGGTGTANKLDDYEEGTWTPDLQDSSGNSATMASSVSNFGKYTKVGNQVFITARIEATSISGLTGGNTVRIFGLPFNGPNQRSTINFNFFDFTVPSGFTMVMGYIDATTIGSGYFQCRKEGTSSGGGLTVTEFGANKGLGCSGTYITD